MGPVGEITETVGGLNRNAGTLSPKYAISAEVSDHLPGLVGMQKGLASLLAQP